jgi:hypothetical protein
MALQRDVSMRGFQFRAVLAALIALDGKVYMRLP